jgi:two-component system sensor histidine kinase ChiS
MMPGMNGYDVCRKIRETHSMYSLPVIMLTAKNRVDDLVKGFESGANDYLPKPFYKEELLARINTLLHAKLSVERLKNNEMLKEEIKRRKTVEEQLIVSQRRLARILDCSDDAIVATNRSGMITFFNQGAERLFGLTTNETINQSLDLLFDESCRETIFKNANPQTLVTTREPLKFTVAAMCRKNDGSNFNAELSISSTWLGDDQLHTIMVKPESQKNPASGTHPLSQIRAFEQAFTQVHNLFDSQNPELIGLRAINPDLDHVTDQLSYGNQDMKLREAIVTTMSTALKHWELTSGKSKIELAEESRIWKTYLDKGTYKTRTLDKYLTLKTLPNKPRWREVLKTAGFVMAHCDLSPDARNELTALSSKMEGLVRSNSRV